jgi:hypothetical protein
MEKANGNVDIDKIGLLLYYFVIDLQSLIIPVAIGKNVCITDIKLIALPFSKHVFIPKDTLFQFFWIRISDLAVAK